MGIYDRNYYRDDQGDNSFFSMNSGGSGRSMVFTLIAINVVVFILDAFTDRISSTSTIGQVAHYLSLSESDAFQPWYWFRFLTAAFSHASGQHIFGNMIVLFFFGRPIETMYGSKKFLWMYLTAAVFGNLIWLLGELPNGGASSVLGASGATTAVFLLFCIHFPHQKIFLLFFPFFGIPAWIMGILFVGHDIVGQLAMTETSNVAFLVHLVGAAYAYLFYRTRWSMDQLLPFGFAGGGSISKLLKPKPKLRVHDPNAPTNDDKLEAQADTILKKLHEKGESSLSGRERRVLEEYSRSIKQRK